ncbi:hypothetical protein CDD83_9436 [Cordyceps sp. RAO-2017]|nr:hypothetical protein CDD83_9436 [Cordyceps sp. RAO-2017]
MSDLEEAIAVARQVIKLTDNHPVRPACLNNLGNKLERRYQRTGEVDALEQAILVARHAVSLTAEDHPDRAAWLTNCGVKLEMRHELTGEPADVQEATACHLGAWNCRAAIPLHRVKAAAPCIKLLATQGKFEAAADLGKEVVDLLPTVNTRLLGRGDQQFVMSTFAGVATDLCALLLKTNRPIEALQYLEKGRAAIIGRLIDKRSDASELARCNPDMASRYKSLLDEVNKPLEGLEQGPNRRREAAAALDACIREIRSLAGHERFLLGLTTAEMQECASGGSIVVVNITYIRSDAIIVSPGGIKALKLAALSASDTSVWLNQDWSGRRSERREKNMLYSRHLAWLWDVCVAQIVQEVRAAHDLLEGCLPRVWWIGTGLASSLPFHAAGTHTVGSAENAYSKVVSSYTPSIKALAYSQSRVRRDRGTRQSLLIASMPTTPGLRKLPGVIEETGRVSQVADGHGLAIELLENPSVESVVEGLQRCSIAHFACHGSTDHRDPSNSGLVFQKSAAEHDRLSVYRISDLSQEQARLAYLSACSTAENKAARLTDEVIHIVSGLQVAGFPHAVGCLWPSVDRVCVEVARRFYSSFLGREGLGWRDGAVARSLREAVVAVRSDDYDMPLNWAQFVHYGA